MVFFAKGKFFPKNVAVIQNSTWSLNTMLSFRKSYNVLIQRQLLDKQMDRGKEGQTQMYRTFPVMAGGPK